MKIKLTALMILFCCCSALTDGENLNIGLPNFELLNQPVSVSAPIIKSEEANLLLPKQISFVIERKCYSKFTAQYSAKETSLKIIKTTISKHFGIEPKAERKNVVFWEFKEKKIFIQLVQTGPWINLLVSQLKSALPPAFKRPLKKRQ